MRDNLTGREIPICDGTSPMPLDDAIPIVDDLMEWLQEEAFYPKKKGDRGHPSVQLEYAVSALLDFARSGPAELEQLRAFKAAAPVQEAQDEDYSDEFIGNLFRAGLAVLGLLPTKNSITPRGESTPDAGLSEPERPEGDATAQTSGRVPDGSNLIGPGCHEIPLTDDVRESLDRALRNSVEIIDCPNCEGLGTVPNKGESGE